MPHLKNINFYQNRPKIKLFLQKNAKFSSAGGSAPDPRASGGWGLRPQPPQTHPPHCKFLATRMLQTPNTQPPIADIWAWSCFALLIFMPPEFSLMPRFKSISFYRMISESDHVLQISEFCRYLSSNCRYLSLIMFCSANFYATRVLPDASF